jgi:predicted TIM-barrel fold metal-dependent hydrolase
LAVGRDLPPPSRDFGEAMIDGHCHAFNAKDLSPSRFIRYTLIDYPGPDEVLVSGIEDRDLLDGIIETILELAGTRLAPSVTGEINYLNSHSGGDPTALLADAQTEEITNNLTAFLARQPVVGPDDDYRKQGEAEVYDQVMQAAMEGQAGGEDTVAVSGEVLEEAERRIIAERFLQGDFEESVAVAGRSVSVRQLFKWIPLFRRYRHVLVDQLVQRHRNAKWNPVLIAPAMVDFGRFVREEPVSPLNEQVLAWSRISKRPGGPAVHGYVPFCPLRQALHGHSVEQRLREGPAPLTIVEDALQQHGFLGVKLYPPMGFQAVGNAQRNFGRYPFTDDVLRDRFGDSPNSKLQERSPELGREIDEALSGLYDLCERLDAPIMAHGGHGNAIKRFYGELSDPWLWRSLFEAPRQRSLRVMLAHYGSFDEPSEDPMGKSSPWPDEDEPPPIARTKEAAIARFLRTAPQAPVFVDISFLSDVLTLQGPERERMVSAFREFMTQGIEDHIVFGTDWTMLGVQRDEDRYNAAISDFWRECGMNSTQVAKVLRRNFVRYAGLERGSPTRIRLDRFNASYGMPDRLALLDG